MTRRRRRLVLHLAPLPMVRKVDVDVNRAVRQAARRRDPPAHAASRDRLATCRGRRPTRACELDEEAAADRGVPASTRATSTPTRSRSGPRTDGTRRRRCASRSSSTTSTRSASHRRRRPAPTELAISDAEIRASSATRACFSASVSAARGSRARSTRRTSRRSSKLFQAAATRRCASHRAATRRRRSIAGRTGRTSRITIDQRRQLDVEFDGVDPTSISDEQLREQLTFDRRGSADDVEAGESARAITTYLQARGYFDARVTWTRERFPSSFDRDHRSRSSPAAAPRRARRSSSSATHALDADKLADRDRHEAARLDARACSATTTTRPRRSSPPTSIASSRRTAARATARRASWSARAATPAGARRRGARPRRCSRADRGDGLYVRFTIDEGAPTLLARRSVVEHGDAGKTLEQRALCTRCSPSSRRARRAAARDAPTMPALPRRSRRHLAFREDDVARTRDQLARLPVQPRPAARARSTTRPCRSGRTEVDGALRARRHPEAEDRQDRDPRQLPHAQLGDPRPQLELRRGRRRSPTDALAEGARRLRNTGLFDAVNIDLPDLDSDSAGAVNASSRVEERYDYLAQLDVEVGYSSYNGAVRHAARRRSRTSAASASRSISRHRRLRASASTSNSGDAQDCASSASRRRCASRSGCSHVSPLRVPDRAHRRSTAAGHAAVRPAHHRGRHARASPTWRAARRAPRPAGAHHDLGLHYDFRLRSATSTRCARSAPTWTTAQVAVTTRTGSVGVDVRVGAARRPQRPAVAARARGRLPARGLGCRIAEPWLLGQDTFIKLSAAASKFFAIGQNLVLRGDLRYDQGIPLGGAVLLPEVERFFAGGDYDRARLRGRPAARPRSSRSACRRSTTCTQIRDHPRRRQHPRARQPRRPGADLEGASPARCSPTRASSRTSGATVTVDDIRPSVGHGPARADPVRHRRARVRHPAPAPARRRPARPHGTSTSPPAPSSEVWYKARPYGTRTTIADLEDAAQEAPDQAQDAHEAPDRRGQGGQEACRAVEEEVSSSGVTPEQTRCVMTQIVMPMHTNGVAGVMFGGIMMQWIDVCAGVAAMRHAAGAVLTASIDRLDFLSPVHVGEIVVLQAQVNYVARTSMEVGCRVETEDMRTGTPALRHEGVPDVRRDRRARPAAPDARARAGRRDDDRRRHAEAERRRKRAAARRRARRRAVVIDRSQRLGPAARHRRRPRALPPGPDDGQRRGARRRRARLGRDPESRRAACSR